MWAFRPLGPLVCAWVVATGSPVRADVDDGCVASAIALKGLLSAGDRHRWELRTDADSSRISRLDVSTIRQAFDDVDPNEPHQGWFMPKVDETTAASPPVPSVALARKFLEQATASAAACVAVRQVASRAGVGISTGARKPRTKPNGSFDRTFIELTKAVISPDGKEALAYVSTASGRLAGCGYLQLFSRDAAGSWKATSMLGLWIS